VTSPARPALTLPGSFEGVVLDLDGLLVRSEDQWWRAKETIFARHGVAFEVADHLAVLGTADEVTARYFAERFGADPASVDDIRVEYLAIAGELFGHGVEVNPGAIELLAHLRGRVPVGLASNTRLDLVTTILASTPFADAFEAIVTADDGTPKPAPDLYLIACQRLGVAPAESVALEDSPTGVAAAKAAGLTCIGIPSHPDEPLPMADVVVGSLLDLL
jgi:HAD superfamily hydrolase (TIGR01509 family)